MSKPYRTLSHQSQASGQKSHGSGSRRTSIGGLSSSEPADLNSAPRVVPSPIVIPNRQHKSVVIDEFDQTLDPKEIKGTDYYEEIRKKPIKLLMTREISHYYSRETYLVTTIKEILIYAIFLIIVSILVLDSPSTDIYMFTSSVADMFTSPHSTSVYFKDIDTIPDLWKYLDSSADVLGEMFQANADKTSFESVPSENLLIGVPRIRSVRVKNHTCDVPEGLERSFPACYGQYRHKNRDERPFGDKQGTAWTYSSGGETEHMYTTYGTISTYGGGGYYKDLKKDVKVLKKELEELRQKNWIDEATRAVVLDFTAYNANLNLFCIVRLLFEIPSTGGMVPSFIIHTLRISDHDSNDVMSLAFTVIFIVMFVFYTIEELYEMTYFKWQFITSFWNYVDVGIVMCSYLVVTAKLYETVTITSMLSGLETNDDKFASFDHLLLSQYFCNISLSLLVFLCWFKVIKYLNINHCMLQLMATLQLAAQDLWSYTIIFIYVIFSFGYLGFLLFRCQHEFYLTPLESVWTILRAGVGDFSYDVVESIQPVLGPLYFFLVLFLLSHVFVVMYIAILLASYTEVRSEICSTPPQMKLGDILRSWMVDIVRTFSRNMAVRVRESFNKKKMMSKFQDVRYLLMRCGFTELEVNLFLAKYEISEDRVMTEEDLYKIMQNFKAHGAPDVQLAHEIVRKNVEGKLTTLETAVQVAETKIEVVLKLLEIIEEKMASNRGT